MLVRYPKISIVSPSFNKKEFIERCILSVLNQNYPNLEYIIIDGGSTDGSVEIIKKYEKYLTFWVSELDNGQVNAINKGLRKTTGEIAAWLNSDDFYYPGVFAKVAEEFLKNPNIDLLYGDSVLVSEKGKALIKQISEGINLRLLSIDSYIAQPSTFIKRDLIKKLEFLDASLPYCFDYDFWIRAFKNGKTKYLPLLMSGMTISYKDKTFKHWDQTVEDCLKIQTKYFGSPSIKMYINLIASTSSKYIPHLNSRYLTIKHYLFGIIGYMQNNIFSPVRVLKHLLAILNLVYLRLVRGIWTWNRMGILYHPVRRAKNNKFRKLIIQKTGIWKD